MDGWRRARMSSRLQQRGGEVNPLRTEIYESARTPGSELGAELYDMHHEVLLVLSGCPGNTFAVSRESGLYEVCGQRMAGKVIA